MALNVRHPIWLAVGQPGAWSIAVLFLLESFARSSFATVLPLLALRLFADKETVSLAYTVVAVAAFALSFVIPALIARLTRRWSYTLGAGMLAAFLLLLALDLPAAFVAALMLRTFAAATLNVTMSLYIMDNIARQELVRSEPLRLGLSTLAWTAGPLAGAGLFELWGLAGTAARSLAFIAAQVGFFWYLRLREGGPVRKGPTRPVNPLANIGRFARQPRLRLAWLIAF